MKRILVNYRRASSYSKPLMLITLLSLSFSFVQAQSVTALSFDGVNDRVDLPNILPASYTKEAWVFAPLDNGAVNNNNIVSGTATAFWFPGNQGFRLSAGHTGNFVAAQDPTPLIANTWTHVAVTYDAGSSTLTLFKNGVQVASVGGIGAHGETTLHIGAYLTANFMKGTIDEVRIWSVPLTVTEIRDWMVRKANATHPQWANLTAYYKADDGVGVNLDDSKNANDGTLVGGTAWVTSGAPLGDASVHDYVNVTKTATIVHAGSGESLTATNTAGGAAGIHVYRVDMLPTNRTGTSGLGSGNKYFGVFQAGGAGLTFTAVYNYGTYTSEDQLILYRREDNSSATWSNSVAVQDMNANTFTAAGQAGETGEFVLGRVNQPLPVDITSFSAVKDKNGALLTWATASERNNSGFMIQRSSNRTKWDDLGFVSANPNSGQNKYSFLDANPVKGPNYFRLKQVDTDGNFSYSDIRLVNFIKRSGIFIYPNPAKGKITIDVNQESILNTQAKLYNAQGVMVNRFIITNLQHHVSIASLAKGIYFLELADGSRYKFMKQ